MAQPKKQTTKPGPEADRLKLNVDWETAAEKLAKKPIAPGDVPKAQRYSKTRAKKQKPST